MTLLVENKKARLEYTFLDQFDAGIVLSGGEVKMLRAKRGSLTGAHVRIVNGQVLLLNAQIPAYPFSRNEEYDPIKTRHLLLHQSEIIKLIEAQKIKGYAIVPIGIFAGKRFIKVRIAVAKGKKEYERREEIKKRDLKREVSRDFKQKLR